MSALNKGAVSITPVTLNCEASLENLLQVAVDSPAPAYSIDVGWGGLQDDPEVLGRIGVRLGGTGEPVKLEASETWPERLQGRVYWRQVNYQARRMMPDVAEQIDAMSLEAADIVISPAVEGNSYLVLASTKNPTALTNYVIPAVGDLARSVDSKSTVTTTTSPLDLGDNDFFRWLMYRAHNAKDLTNKLQIAALRGISGQDIYSRATSVSRGADADRPELLAMIMGRSTIFGPAKVDVIDEDLGLDVDFDLRLDGGFDVHLGRSHYEDDPPRPTKGYRLAMDLAYKVIPDIRSAWTTDTEWLATHREGSMQAARDQLREALDP